MATVRKRGLKWQVQVRRRGFEAISRSFTQQRDAERWGVLKERELDLLESQGRSGAKACDASVNDLLVRYRTTIVPRKRGAAREAYMVAALERAAFTSVRADKLSSRQIASYRDARLAVVTAATVVRELGLLQHTYELARKAWGYEHLDNPVRDVQKPPLPQGRTRRLAAQMVRRGVLFSLNASDRTTVVAVANRT